MTAENYYIERKDSSHKVFGIIGTVAVHALIVGILLFVALTPPDPPLEEAGGGVRISLGDENAGGPSLERVPEPTPSTAVAPVQDNAVAPEEITGNDDESVEIKKHEQPKDKKTVEPVKDVPKKTEPDLPKRTVNTNALFTKKMSGGGGHGKGDNAGNQGAPDGDINGDPEGHGTGAEGPGNYDGSPGNGIDGLRINIDRRVERLPSIEDNSKAVGKVVVKIVVNREGRVIKAFPGQQGSTTTDPALIEKSKQGAMRTKFYVKEDAPDEQYGTMTFEYKFKP